MKLAMIDGLLDPSVIPYRIGQGDFLFSRPFNPDQFNNIDQRNLYRRGWNIELMDTKDASRRLK